MNAQTKAGKSLGEHRHDPSGVRFPLTADDKVIGKTCQKTSALQAGLDLLREPRIQDMMEHDIGQHGRDDPALHDAGVRVLEHPTVYHAGPQPFPDEAPDAAIIDPLA